MFLAAVSSVRLWHPDSSRRCDSVEAQLRHHLVTGLSQSYVLVTVQRFVAFDAAFSPLPLLPAVF
jgi:hypothetical protein